MADFPGTAGNDTYPGTADDDTIHDGGGGDDNLMGGEGDDEITVTGGQDFAEGGDGEDLLIVDFSAFGSDILTGTSGGDVVRGFFGASGGGAPRVDFLDFERFDITTGGGDDIIDVTILGGGDGEDVVRSGGGSDIIDTGAGVATIDGGDGFDTWRADFSAATEDGTLFLETTAAGGTFDFFGGEVTNIEAVDLILGSGNDFIFTLTGSAGENATDVIDGGAGDDVIGVGSGQDQVEGGAGSDDQLFIDFSAFGSDFVSSVDGARGRLSNGGATGVTYAGFERFDIITGSGDDDIDLTAAGFGAGDDVVDAGIGTDTVDTGAGVDVLEVDYSGASTGIVSLLTPGGGGAYSGSFSAGAGFQVSFENVEAFDVVGGDAQDAITTGDGDDRLDGAGGNDTLSGGNGDDRYYVQNAGDVVIETSGGGEDIVFSEVDFNAQSMGAAVEIIVLRGNSDLVAVGNGLDNVLFGNNGDNVLNGYKGADDMRGAFGDDIYVVDNEGDQVTEELFASGGVDRVNASISYTLGAEIENLTLLGGADLEGTGNGELNRIVGNRGDNEITGRGDVDILTGGLGVDTFVYNAVSDSTYGGYDRITDLEDDDVIDLKNVDAVEGGGEDDFTLVEAFNGVAGEMIRTFNGDFTFLVGDTDGDGRGDFRIALLGGDYTDFDNFLGAA